MSIVEMIGGGAAIDKFELMLIPEEAKVMQTPETS